MSREVEVQVERAAFEDWYVQNTFDFERNPIGSRECGLQWKAWQARAALQADAGAVPNGWTLVPISPHIGLLSTGGFYAAAACCEPSITARHLYECVLQEARERYQRDFRMPMPVAPLTAAMSREQSGGDAS